MKQKLQSLLETTIRSIANAKNQNVLSDLETIILGRKGELTKILRSLATLSPEEKKEIGKFANEIKKELQHKFDLQKQIFEAEKLEKIAEKEWIDITFPGTKTKQGSRHPISRFIDEVEDVFGKMGFEFAEGPEIEDDWHNFTALNLPPDHPARDMQDTFWIKNLEKMVLRTQTSDVQIRYMENNKPPLRIIAPGKTYRKDSDATHSPMFHQYEGLMIDKKCSLANLKAVLLEALRQLISPDLNLRFRLSYFPFTEPSIEVDCSCVNCGGKGEMPDGKICKVCKRTGWLEIGGAGMVHPNVLKNVGINPDEYNGFAFGFGLERQIMIKYKIDDLRLFFENDLRFLEQFA